MTRIAATAAATAALMLSACGPKALDLPDQPVDRAATCGVVTAIEARTATPDIKQPLPFTAQLGILHYALLAGSEGEEFSAETATAVNGRMSELQEAITEGEWQPLAPACDAAFPATTATQVSLPAGDFEAQLACDELGNFIGIALRSQEDDYVSQLADYREMGRNLDASLGQTMPGRVGTDLPAQQQARRAALADAAKLGPPVDVMRQCVERFG
jgi:hypothetical protein